MLTIVYKYHTFSDIYILGVEKLLLRVILKNLFCMKVIINLVLARDYALGQIQHIPEMAFIWSLICMDLHMPNKIGMSKSENDSLFK